jgi:tRNA threonylcarbamoyladenosine biosynthesis protein TsaE
VSPILSPKAVELISQSVAQTHRFGYRLGLLLQPGDVICLEGNLGSGKTCFVQGLGQALGVREVITSPTFTLIGEYRGSHQTMPLFHIDVYRLDPLTDLDGVGLWDYLYDDGVCAIEWADRIRETLPQEALWVSLRNYLDDSRRNIVLEGYGERYEALLRQYKRSVFGV